MAIDGFYPDYPDWPFSPDGAHHRDYHDNGPYHHHPLNPPNDMFHRLVADERCAGECDDQLAVFSSVGRGLKGDGYKVRLIEGDSGETFLEGLRQDSATGEYSRDWISDNIDGGKLTYKYNLHPFTSPKTFTITFAYHKTGSDEDDWTWTTPSIPYIWGDEDINVPSIEAFDGLQEQIDDLTVRVDANYTELSNAYDTLIDRMDALESENDELRGEIDALHRALGQLLDHIYGSNNVHSGSSDWEHYQGADLYVGEQTQSLTPGDLYWNYARNSAGYNIPVGNLNMYGGYNSSGTEMNAISVIRSHDSHTRGDIWAHGVKGSQLGTAGVEEFITSTNSWMFVAQ